MLFMLCFVCFLALKPRRNEGVARLGGGFVATSRLLLGGSLGLFLGSLWDLAADPPAWCSRGSLGVVSRLFWLVTCFYPTFIRCVLAALGRHE